MIKYEQLRLARIRQQRQRVNSTIIIIDGKYEKSNREIQHNNNIIK